MREGGVRCNLGRSRSIVYREAVKGPLMCGGDQHILSEGSRSVRASSSRTSARAAAASPSEMEYNASHGDVDE